MSLTWYTWLEQGRDISPSAQVINALARTLRLSEAEHAYALDLAGHQRHATCDDDQPLPPHAQRMLDALGDTPAFAITSTWSILAWNAAYEAFYPTIATVPPPDRNLLWLVFTDPRLRTMLTNWDLESRRFLAQFRAEAGPRVHHAPVAALLERLQGASQDFRVGWADHDVEQFSSRERQFTHPAVGDLHLEQHRLSLTDCPGLDLIAYTSAPDTDSGTRLARLRPRPRHA